MRNERDIMFFAVKDMDLTIQMSRCTDDTFAQKETSSILKLNEFMYFKISMSEDGIILPFDRKFSTSISRSRSKLVLSLQRCYATNEKNSSEKHFMIKRG